MRVLFSNPPWWQEVRIPSRTGPKTQPCLLSGVRAGSRWPHTTHSPRRPGQFAPGGYLPYPFFMGYATTYLAQKTGAEVVFRDSIALAESMASYIRFLDENRFDYLFLESASPSWAHDSALIRTLHARYPALKIVLTGPITVGGEDLLAHLPLHACLRGEYEKGAVRVIEGAEGMLDFDLLSRDELNQAPFPYYDDTYALRYWDGNPRGQAAPHAQVWSSRGCPFKCIFCVWPATMTGNDPDGTGKRTVRYYSADYMEAFLGELTARYPYRSIYFDDDTFNLGDAHVQAMCGVMRKIGLPWSAMCRADTISRETWAMMRDSGCFGIKLGFESGNQKVVDTIVNKRLDLEKAREVVHWCKSLGLTIHGTFTIGLPGETPEQMDDTRRFIASLPFDTHQLSGCAEIEGTPLANLSERGHLDRYEGAVIDTSYLRLSDGSRKIDRLSSGPAGARAEDRPGRLLLCAPSGVSAAPGPASSASLAALESAARAAGRPVLVFGSTEPGGTEMPAFPVFRPQPHCDDPYCGALEDFLSTATQIQQDLAGAMIFRTLRPEDRLALLDLTPGQVLGVANWLRAGIAPDQAPQIALVLNGPAAAARPDLLRFALRRLDPAFQPSLDFFSPDVMDLALLTDLVGRPVRRLAEAIPVPPLAEAGTDAAPPVVAILAGGAEADVSLPIADLLHTLLTAHPGIQWRVQAGTADVPALTALAAAAPAVTVVPAGAGADPVPTLLEGVGLVVLPDRPAARPGRSARITAAIARGLPVVAADGTLFAQQIRRHGDGGVLFPPQGDPVTAVAAAVAEALARQNDLQRRARAGAELWRQDHSPALALAALLGQDETA